jgi:hypothetical protein
MHIGIYVLSLQYNLNSFICSIMILSIMHKIDINGVHFN